MAGTLVAVRMPLKLLEQAQSVATHRGYGTVQDFIRETVRREVGHALIEAIAGSQPGIKHMTRASREAALKTFYAERGWDYNAFARRHAEQRARK